MEEMVRKICREIIEEKDKEWENWRCKIEKDLEEAMKDIKEIKKKMNEKNKEEEQKIRIVKKELEKVREDIEEVILSREKGASKEESKAEEREIIEEEIDRGRQTGYKDEEKEEVKDYGKKYAAWQSGEGKKKESTWDKMQAEWLAGVKRTEEKRKSEEKEEELREREEEKAISREIREERKGTGEDSAWEEVKRRRDVELRKREESIKEREEDVRERRMRSVVWKGIIGRDEEDRCKIIKKLIDEIIGKKEGIRNIIEKKGETGIVMITELTDKEDRRKIMEKGTVLQRELGVKVEEDLTKEEIERRWRIRMRGNEEKNKGRSVWWDNNSIWIDGTEWMWDCQEKKWRRIK